MPENPTSTSKHEVSFAVSGEDNLGMEDDDDAGVEAKLEADKTPGIDSKVEVDNEAEIEAKLEADKKPGTEVQVEDDKDAMLEAKLEDDDDAGVEAATEDTAVEAAMEENEQSNT